MVTKNKPSFTACGKDFDTEAEAEAYEKLHKAASDYDRARDRWIEAVAEVVKTADGHPFKFDRYNEYWHVVENFLGRPAVLSVQFRYHTKVRLDDNDEVILELYTETRHGGEKYAEHKIKNLYYHKENADKALVKKLQELKAEFDETIQIIEAGGESKA